MWIDILDLSKRKIGEVTVPDGIFSDLWQPWLLQEVLTELAAGVRRGTRKTKTRAEVSGGGKKPWRQKGTGRARQGSNTSPIWVRGGTAHGPKPKVYVSNIPKKKKLLAMRQLMGFKFRESQLFVIEMPDLSQVKTKLFAGEFKTFIDPLKSVLLVVNKENENIYRVARNIPWVKVIYIEGLNIYDCAKYDAVVLLKGSISKFKEKMLCGIQCTM